MTYESNSDSRESDTQTREEPSLTPILDAKTFRQWKSEISRFRTQTQNRLELLSKMLSEHHICQNKITEEAVKTSSYSPCEATVATMKPSSNQMQNSPTCIESEIAMIQPKTYDQPDENIDMFDRLNAIKNRLAKQIENAS